MLGLGWAACRPVDRLADPWLVALLNLPALVIIVLAYVWAGLTETAAIIAVALNKLPIATVTVREGARSLDRRARRDGAGVPHGPLGAAAPCGAFRSSRPTSPRPRGPACRWSGRSCSSSSCSGRPNGVGFEIGVAFQLFDVTRILAYAIAFVAVMLAIETFLVQPLERHVSRWRAKPA